MIKDEKKGEKTAMGQAAAAKIDTATPTEAAAAATALSFPFEWRIKLLTFRPSLLLSAALVAVGV